MFAHLPNLFFYKSIENPNVAEDLMLFERFNLMWNKLCSFSISSRRTGLYFGKEGASLK